MSNVEDILSTFKSDPVEVVATSAMERMESRVDAVRWLQNARDHARYAASSLDKSGDTEQYVYVQTVMAAIDDALESLTDVAGGKPC